MRFALIATSVAAVVAVPLAASIAAPMGSDAFVSAVRCTAYEGATQPGVDLSTAKFRLNSEALRQPAAVAAEAQKAASDIAHAVAEADNSNALAARACPASRSLAQDA
jgi:hypothetical protein